MPAKPELTQVEKDKLTLTPDIDFRDIAQRPFADLTPSEIGMFKWSGVYLQLQGGYFMIRLRIPGGLLSAEQLGRAGQLAKVFGDGNRVKKGRFATLTQRFFSPRPALRLFFRSRQSLTGP